MLLLEGPSRTVSEALQEMLTKENDEHLTKMGDFHGTVWEIFHDGEGTVYIAITMYISRGKLKKWNLEEHLAKIYGAENILDEDDFPDILEEAADVVVTLKDTDEWRKEVLSKGDRERLTELCDKYASLYKHCMSVAFAHHFKMFNDEVAFDPVKISYRKNEAMYLRGTKDNLAVYFSMVFETDDDLLYGRLFLQEFADAKNHKRNLAAAPSCSVSKEHPRGLVDVKGVEAEAPRRLWVTLNLFAKHTNLKQETLEKTTELLMSFCNYVRYHISCSHAYIHSRMRSRHTSLLQVLNRAKTNQTDHVATQID